MSLSGLIHTLIAKKPPKKEKKKNPLESHQGAMKIDATKKEAWWKLCLTTELLLFFN